MAPRPTPGRPSCPLEMSTIFFFFRAHVLEGESGKNEKKRVFSPLGMSCRKAWKQQKSRGKHELQQLFIKIHSKNDEIH